ncbi:MAG TPA: hypothetical protein PK603_08005, partial [Bacteroidales bacterium]|nr:hypothetical protein [Bacteroidales bacterium]
MDNNNNTDQKNQNSFVSFKDERFKAFCVRNFDTDNDGEISFEEASEIRIVRCDDMGIKSLEGIEHFVNLRILRCEFNQLKSLDLSGNKYLQQVFCSLNKIRHLNMEENEALQVLQCD